MGGRLIMGGITVGELRSGSYRCKAGTCGFGSEHLCISVEFGVIYVVLEGPAGLDGDVLT